MPFDLAAAGSWASLIGLLVTVVGFIATIINVRRSRRAAESAEDAAQRTRGALVGMQAIADVSSALADLAHLKSFHRAAHWQSMPDRYDSLRKKLVMIRMSRPDLNEDQLAALQGAITHLATFEKAVDSALKAKKEPSNWPRLNAILTEQIDNLTEILTQLQREEVDRA